MWSKYPWMLYPETCFSCWNPITKKSFLAWSILLDTSQEEELQGSSWPDYNKTINKYPEFPCLPDQFLRLLWITVRPLHCLTSFTHKKCPLSPCFIGKQPTTFSTVTHTSSALDLNNLLLANLAVLLPAREFLCCLGIVQSLLTPLATSGFFSRNSSAGSWKPMCFTAVGLLRGVKIEGVVKSYR